MLIAFAELAIEADNYSKNVVLWKAIHDNVLFINTLIACPPSPLYKIGSRA